MMNFFEDQDKSLCCGCSACYSACPQNCIVMMEDKDGFSYPSIDENRCINCNICINVCPIANSEKLKNPEVSNCYALVSKDDRVVLSSTSGGAFSSIVNAFCINDYIIVGAEMCKDLIVRHTYIDNKNQINKYQKSKYFQSQTINIYPKIKAFLEQGKRVLFTGTGCQVAGLKGYLHKEYDNLLMVDLICHGVPSSKIFRKYIYETEKKYGSQIIDYKFRVKSNNNSHSNLIFFQDGRTIETYISEDPFMKMYNKALGHMPSCYSCPFACSDRVGDITIGDYWGYEKYYDDFDIKKGVSLIIPNTKKGSDVIKNINDANLHISSIEHAKIGNGKLNMPTARPLKREEFWNKLQTQEFEKTIKEFAPLSFKQKIYAIVPIPVKKLLKKLMRI